MPQPRTTETPAERRSRLERERVATELAIERALERQRVDLKLKEHDEDIEELRRGRVDMATAITALGTQMTRVETQISEQVSKAISNRTLVLGILAIVATIIGSAIASGHI